MHSHRTRVRSPHTACASPRGGGCNSPAVALPFPIRFPFLPSPYVSLISIRARCFSFFLPSLWFSSNAFSVFHFCPCACVVPIACGRLDRSCATVERSRRLFRSPSLLPALRQHALFRHLSLVRCLPQGNTTHAPLIATHASMLARSSCSLSRCFFSHSPLCVSLPTPVACALLASSPHTRNRCHS
jgi:hypothetical protein